MLTGVNRGKGHIMKIAAIAEWIRQLDGILRGRVTRPELLKDGTVQVRVGPLVVVLILLAMISGLCTAGYAVLGHDEPMYMQLFADAVKVPMLFFLTLLVTFPSLYVFNALVGSDLRIDSMLRLLLASMAATLALLASFGPIVVFFSVCTTSYPFMVLLNVLVYGVAGLMGLKFLLQALHRISPPEDQVPAWGATLEPSEAAEVADPPDGPVAGEGSAAVPPLPPGAGPALPPARKPPSRINTVTRIWVIVFALVGAQMSWVLRPFIGSPTQPFEWFRERESNFFIAVWNALANLFSG